MRKLRWKILGWVLGIVILLLIAFFYGFVPWSLTKLITTNRFHYRDPNDGKTPLAWGMPFENVEFKSHDGILLKGWYVPANAGHGQKTQGTIIYCHGLNRSRVEMLPMAQFGHKLGYDGLLFDFRHQGASGGRITSLGYWERLDAEAAVDEALVRQQAPHPVILWGVSMGAAAALMAAAEDPQVDAVISDSTFLSFARVIKHHYLLVRGMIRRRWWWFPPLPSFPLTNEVIAWSASRAHFRPSDFDLQKAVERIGSRPILFVAVQGDVRMPPSIAEDLYSLAASPYKQIVIVPGQRHGEGFNEGREPYEKAVTTFLESLQTRKSSPAL
jgi:pimeloyl-ACP methyl ester carboxylesterase